MNSSVEGRKRAEIFRKGVAQAATEVYNCRNGRKRKGGRKDIVPCHALSPFLDGMKLRTRENCDSIPSVPKPVFKAKLCACA